jgi:hypothetical protein
MRPKIVIGLALVTVGLLAALPFTRRHLDPVSVKFEGYWDWKRFDTNIRGRVQAQFSLTNHTARRIYTSDARARIQVRTAQGWTDYFGSNEVLKVDKMPIGAFGKTQFLRDFPREPVRWRLHVSYVVQAPDWARLRVLNPVRSLAKLEDKTLDAYSQEISSEPAR